MHRRLKKIRKEFLCRIHFQAVSSNGTDTIRCKQLCGGAAGGATDAVEHNLVSHGEQKSAAAHQS